MILQSLNALYETLQQKGKLDAPGWQPENITFALIIDEEGHLLRITDLRQEQERGRKKVMVPRSMSVPAREKRSANVCANFLCDNATYFLGIDAKGKPERTMLCFQACAGKHMALLKNADSSVAGAVKAFFQHWQPAQAGEHPILQLYMKELLSGANLVFEVNGVFAQEDAACRKAWDDAGQDQSGAVIMQCLVTGEKAPIAILHPAIKGIPDAQPTGASLVSFNARAFESYGHVDAQGLNAPVSEKAAFAYTAALQWLIRSMEHHTRLGDMMVVYWAEGNEEGADDMLNLLMGGEDESVDNDALHHAISRLAEGEPVDWKDFPVKSSNRFYILGLSPNAARLSIRFFTWDTFGNLAKHITQFDREIQIAHGPREPEVLPLWWLLRETANQKSKDKKPSPQLAGDLLRAMITGARYPETLFYQVQLRLRAESGNLTYGKAALIKAYLTRNGTGMKTQAKEGIQVELNENTAYAPYLLGRLFSLLEGLQIAANPTITATIKDKYFNSACATPAVVFPRLISLAQAHTKKIRNSKPGAAIAFSKQIGEIMGKMTDSYPARLNLQDQGVFQLGYYHQTQKRYMKKEEKENV